MWSEAWPSQEILNLRKQFEAAIRLVEAPSREQPDEVTRALSRFLVVRASGYLEAVVDECCRSLIRSKAAPNVASFASSWFGTGRNPSPGKLLELVGKFNGDWKESLCKEFDEDDEYLRRELDLLVSKRNRIAHGLGEGIGARKALEFASTVTQVTNWFVKTFDPR